MLATAVLGSTMVASCAGDSADAPRAYRFRVPPGQTYDLIRGQVIPPDAHVERLAGVKLLFLGEQHTDPRSHEAQLDLLRGMQARGRRLTVALEMLPDGADAALEAWRQGSLGEAEFLERSGWYDAWGHPWRAYRELFLWFREHKIPLRGINVDEKTRAAARKGDAAALPEDVRREAGDLDAVLEPHRDYVLDTLRETGHGENLDAESPQFRSLLRVQTLWDRVLGRRAAGLAQAQPPDGAVVVLIGSGHLAWRLGANLWAAQAGPLPQLSLWDATVARDRLDAGGRAPVPVGIADWARVYVAEDAPPGFPSLAGIKLVASTGGVTMESVGSFAAPYTKPFQAKDVIQSLNGQPVTSVARLRMEFEALAWGETVPVAVLRAGQPVTLTLRLQRD
jgi:uncharacterized iron-regulated protein